MKRIFLLITICLISVFCLSACAKPYDDPALRLTVTGYSKGEEIGSYNRNSGSVGALLKALDGLDYSEDKICNCSPEYVLTFSNGDKFYLKYEPGEPDSFHGICREGRKQWVQADPTDEIQSLLDAILLPES